MDTTDRSHPLPPALNRVLTAATWRWRWRAALRFTARTLVGGLLLTLLLILMGRFYPLTWPLLLLLLGLGLTGVALAVTLAYALLRPYPPHLVARDLDRRLRLDERLTTALDLAGRPGQTPAAIIAAQLADTVTHLAEVDPAQAVPLRWPWPWWSASAGLIAALAVSLWLPNPQLQRLQQQAQTETLLEAQAAQLEEIRADLLANEALLETPAGEEALQTLDNLIEALQENNLRPEEALADLAEAEETLAELQTEAAQQENSLADVAETFNQFATTEDLAQALQRRDMAEAGEFLQAAADPAQRSPAAQEELAEALQQASESAAASGDSELAEALSEAAQALQESLNAQGSGGGDQQATEEALRQAAAALANAEQALGSQEALQEALGNIQEAREQLADAAGEGGEGSEPGEQEASGQGQGQGQGQPGQGNGTGPGQGPGSGSGAGRGEGGDPTQDLFADTPGQEAETNNGPNQGVQGDYDPAYPPIHWGGDGGPLVNPDPQGAEGGLPIGEAPLDPNQPPGPAQVPYNQVYGQYADAAGEALDETYIPLGMKEYIRNYFGALEPE